jgi:hypothetical protein
MMGSRRFNWVSGSGRIPNPDPNPERQNCPQKEKKLRNFMFEEPRLLYLGV